MTWTGNYALAHVSKLQGFMAKRIWFTCKARAVRADLMHKFNVLACIKTEAH